MAILGLQGPLIVHLISVRPNSSVSLNLSLGFVWFKLYNRERKIALFSQKKLWISNTSDVFDIPATDTALALSDVQLTGEFTITWFRAPACPITWHHSKVHLTSPSDSFHLARQPACLLPSLPRLHKRLPSWGRWSPPGRDAQRPAECHQLANPKPQNC